MSRPSPDAARRHLSDLDYCRAALANGSRTFLAASRLLSRRARDPAIALYAFCREADDIIDAGGAGPQTLALLSERLDGIYSGTPKQNPADRAFADVVNRFEIPRALPDALIEGFAWDADGQRYETFRDVLGYATRVAGSVGAMMALIMGARSASQLARACDLGIAMQLSNIARDVGEDARNGRIYLPLSWLREEGLDPDAWIRDPRPEPRIAKAVERLLDAADTLYMRAERGIACLPLGSRAGIFAARFIYAEIGNEVRRNGFDSVTTRAIVSGRRKVELAAMAAGAAGRSLLSAQVHIAERVEEAAYLVDAVGPLSRTGLDTAWWNLPARTARVIEIFERLERDEREIRRIRAGIGREPAASRA